MACKAPPIWVSILFITLGVVVGVLAVLPWFLLPNEIEKTTNSLAVVDSEKSSGFKDFKDPPDNPLIYSCYFWNITNPYEVRDNGAKPIMHQVGPYVYERYAHRINITFLKGGDEVEYQEWGSYNYSVSKSGDNLNAATDSIYTASLPFFGAVIGTGLKETQLGFVAASFYVATAAPGFSNTDIALGFLNGFWPSFVGQIISGIGLNNFLGAINENQTSNNLGYFWATGFSPLGSFADLGFTIQQLTDLFNSSIPGSFLDPNPLSWTDPTSKIQSLISDFGLNSGQAQYAFAYRSADPAKNPAGLYTGSWLWGLTIFQALTALNLDTEALNWNNMIYPNPSMWQTSLPEFLVDISKRQFGRANSGLPLDFPGILNGASTIELPGQEIVFAETGGYIPEIAIWFARFGMNTTSTEFPTVTADNLEFASQPVSFTNDEIDFLFSEFSDVTPPAFLGGVRLGVFFQFFPGFFLMGFPTEWQAANFTYLDTLWTGGADVLFRSQLNATMVQNGGGEFDYPDTLSFSQSLELYLYIKYNLYLGFARNTIVSPTYKGGILTTLTPQQMLFGYNDPFLTLLQGNIPFPVPGVFTDYTLEQAQAKPTDRYTTGKADTRKFRLQLTYNGNATLGAYFHNFNPPVRGSSLTFVGPFRLQSKAGKKTTDEGLLLWVSQVFRELELLFSNEVSLFGITLYRYHANPEYKTVIQSTDYSNPFNFIMDNQIGYHTLYPFYLSFPAWTLVENTTEFNDLVEGVSQDRNNFILSWDFEPITGLAFRAFAPLQGSTPIRNTASWGQTFDFWSVNYPKTVIPFWYIERSNQITSSQADDWKKQVGLAKQLQFGLTVALPIFGFVLLSLGVGLLLWRVISSKSDDMQDFPLSS
jgi:hypothetical protein